MRPIRSLGYRTDVGLRRFDGEVIARDGHLVVRSPDRPTFYWGNFVLFDQAPKAGDVDRWLEIYHEEFAGLPEVRHVAIGWDTPEVGETRQFVAAGFAVESHCALATATPVLAPRHSEDVEVRAISGHADWAAALECQVAANVTGAPDDAYRAFKVGQMMGYRRQVEAGHGEWYGAFLGGELAADCGVFAVEGLGRYQAVGTDPRFRRRGICAGLVYEAGRAAIARFGVRELVIVADLNYHAINVYESAGFVRRDVQYGLLRV